MKDIKLAIHFSSLRLDWGTPQAVFDQLDQEFHFDLDPCASLENRKCARFYSKAQDGLSQAWDGRVFCNPPYGRKIGDWIAKAAKETGGGRCPIAVLLIPSRTDTRYWHDYVMGCAEIRFIKGRLHFDERGPAPFPSAIAIFKAPGRI